MTVLVNSRADLTLEAARRVAWEGEGVELGPRALDAMAQGRDRLERILEHDPDVTIYGVTTGPGQLARTKLTAEQRAQWAGMSPARAAASWGDTLPERAEAPGSPAIFLFAPLTPPIGPQSSGPAQRWLSIEGGLLVEQFRVTFNGLGGFHMGNPGLEVSICPTKSSIPGNPTDQIRPIEGSLRMP